MPSSPEQKKEKKKDKKGQKKEGMGNENLREVPKSLKVFLVSHIPFCDHSLLQPFGSVDAIGFNRQAPGPQMAGL